MGLGGEDWKPLCSDGGEDKGGSGRIIWESVMWERDTEARRGTMRKVM